MQKRFISITNIKCQLFKYDWRRVIIFSHIFFFGLEFRKIDRFKMKRTRENDHEVIHKRAQSTQNSRYLAASENTIC